MSLETDIKAVGADIKADATAVAHTIETDVKAAVVDVKAEAEKIFGATKTEAVKIEGTIGQKLTALESLLASHAKQLATSVKSVAQSDLSRVEAKVDAVIAKLGISL